MDNAEVGLITCGCFGDFVVGGGEACVVSRLSVVIAGLGGGCLEGRLGVRVLLDAAVSVPVGEMIVPCPSGFDCCFALACSRCVVVGSRNRIGNRAFLSARFGMASICCMVISWLVIVSTRSEIIG